jgi:hypothetical protein
MRQSASGEGAGVAPSRRTPGRAVVICAAVVVVSGAVALVSLQPSTSCEMADRYLRTMAHQWPGALAEARGTNPAAFACGGTLAAATTSHAPAFGAGPADPAQRRN